VKTDVGWPRVLCENIWRRWTCPVHLMRQCTYAPPGRVSRSEVIQYVMFETASFDALTEATSDKTSYASVRSSVPWHMADLGLTQGPTAAACRLYSSSDGCSTVVMPTSWHCARHCIYFLRSIPNSSPRPCITRCMATVQYCNCRRRRPPPTVAPGAERLLCHVASRP
jgi:hypothetical protein